MESGESLINVLLYVDDKVSAVLQKADQGIRSGIPLHFTDKDAVNAFEITDLEEYWYIYLIPAP